ncbi:hypothetical protein K431DRAFT_254693 [Polychaeton citri CBS 116435]|uniref:MARVEL domain-containing protein n=1 Tax=Polychaeton citri CBS 116435 TaxID=1314669 RepID=A0A9P4ULG2_9PEZI|nr:hypothetical protein K431DRAFT_254693 [Polychaeton citri CBS 116435]
MGIIKGGALRLFQTVLYAICFCCSAIILGIYSYFLAVLADRDIHIARWIKATEGLSGVAVLYTIFAVVLTCCLGGVSFFAFLAIVLDICFLAAMIALAVLTRDGADSCTGIVNTPLGKGQASSHGGGYGEDGFGTGQNENVTYSVSYGTACKLNTACFAVAIIGALFFLITAGMQVALVRHHKKEKRFGPSPSNNYTSGYGKFWSRKNKKTAAKDVEMTGAGAGVNGVDTRPSHETGYTGTTVGNNDTAGPYDKVNGQQTGHTNDYTNNYTNARAGYHTQPQGTGVNPYGYDNTAPQPQYTTGTATNY